MLSCLVGLCLTFASKLIEILSGILLIGENCLHLVINALDISVLSIHLFAVW